MTSTLHRVDQAFPMWYERKWDNVAAYSLLNESLLQTDRECYCAGPYVSNSPNRISRWPGYSSPSKVFPSKVSPSPTCSRSSFLPPFAHHQSDNLPQQTNFFPYFYITQSFLWVETPFQNVPSIQLFSTLPQKYEKVVLKSNNDKLGNIPKLCHW